MVTQLKSAKEIEDEQKPVFVAEVEEPKAPEPKVAPVKPGKKLTTLSDPIPAHWSFLPYDGDEVIATCCTSNEVFRGTIAEFNEALRNS